MTVKEYIDIYNKYPNPNDNSAHHIHYEGEQEDFEKLVQYNKDLVKTYPWLLPRNRGSGKVADDYDYTYTELDEMPQGWRIAFGDDICKEINDALEDFRDEYQIMQIKEKFGGLRWYDAGAPKEVYDIISKYETRSYKTCIECGEPAIWQSTGWICPFCDACKVAIEEKENNFRFRRIED